MVKMVSLILLLMPVAGAVEVMPTIDNMVRAAEIKYELPPGLLRAVVKVESNGRPHALNPNDGTKEHKAAGIKIPSFGLIQIQCDSARTVGFKGRCKELMKPEVNIEFGSKYLKWLLEEHDNNIAWALSCYNSGPVSKCCKNKRYIHYVGLVMNAWLELKE